MIASIFILVISLILFLSYLGKGRRPKNYPPGPYSLPIIGNILQLSLDPYLDYMRLRKQYGDIMAIDLGGMKSVIISDYKLIKEAYSHTAISGRPPIPVFMDQETGLPKGISFTHGKVWTEQRRFVLKTLRDFGFGKKSLESTVQEEIKELIEDLRKDVNTPICTNERFNIAVFNALWALMAGERHSHSEKNMQTLIRHLTENQENNKITGSMMCFPWFTKMFPEYSGLNSFKKNNEPVFNFIKEVVSSHKQTFESGNNRDLLDCYLEQIKQTTDTDSSFHASEADSHMVMMVYDLFVGGTQTTSTSLSWTFQILARNADIQEKMSNEIKKVVGDSRLPSYSDKPNLPYVEAVLMEVMRYSSIVSNALRHAVEDVEFYGYFIPKGTAVFANLYCVNYDPKIWGDPENFRPERFLSEDGNKVVKNEALIPFGYGRRFCPGESLARDQLFLFTTSLFQRFRVSLGPNEDSKKIEVVSGSFMRMTKPHQLVLQDRYAS